MILITLLKSNQILFHWSAWIVNNGHHGDQAPVIHVLLIYNKGLLSGLAEVAGAGTTGGRVEFDQWKSTKTGGLKEQKFTTVDSDHDFAGDSVPPAPPAQGAGWRISGAVAIHVVAKIDSGRGHGFKHKVSMGPQHLFGRRYASIMCFSISSQPVLYPQFSYSPTCSRNRTH